MVVMPGSRPLVITAAHRPGRLPAPRTLLLGVTVT
jgi:hypothetical protein